jgi:hypothetical protein
VIDRACSRGTQLLAVADRVRLAGQEIQESAAAVAALNLRGHAHGVPYEIHVGDSLRDSQLGPYLGAAAAVVCEPPFDLPQWPSAELTTYPRWEFGIPAPRDSELARVQHCYAHLRPRGVPPRVKMAGPVPCSWACAASVSAIDASLTLTDSVRLSSISPGIVPRPSPDVRTILVRALEASEPVCDKQIWCDSASRAA